MKYTLLELVQTIASSMDSVEVNSIGDSTESMQIATIIRTVYFDIIGRANLPEHFSLVTLDASTDNTKPVLMTLPSNVAKLEWLKYNKLNESADPLNMQHVQYMPVGDFLMMMHSLNPENSEVLSFNHTVGADTFTVLYRNDKQPDWYTTFDDNTVIFDSYDAAIETTLQKSKTLGYGKLVIPFSMSDTFTVDLDEPQFTLLLNDAKSLAWMELKQSQHPIAERNSRRAWTHLQKDKSNIDNLTDFEKLPDFGRIGRTGYGRLPRYWPGKFRAR